jgi:hypothetical protein
MKLLQQGTVVVSAANTVVGVEVLAYRARAANLAGRLIAFGGRRDGLTEAAKQYSGVLFGHALPPAFLDLAKRRPIATDLNDKPAKVGRFHAGILA